MKTKRLVWFGLLLAMVYSCAGGGKNTSGKTARLPEVPFPVADTFSGEFLPEGMEQGGWMRIYYTPHGIFCENDKPGRSGYIFQLIDTLSGKILTQGGLQGRGPGELIQWAGSHYDNNTSIFYTRHFPQKELARFAIRKDSIFPLTFFKSHDYMNYAINLTDSTYCMLDLFPNQSVFINTANGKTLFKIPNMPLKDPLVNYQNNLINITFGTQMESNRNRTKVIMTESKYNTIRIYAVENNTLRLIRDTMYLKADYKISKNGWPHPTRNNIQAGGITFVTDRLLYILTHFRKSEYYYSTNAIEYDPIPNSYLLVFDWDLNYYGCYELDKYLYSFTVAPDDKTLYGYTFDENDHSRIIKYPLKIQGIKDLHQHTGLLTPAL